MKRTIVFSLEVVPRDNAWLIEGRVTSSEGTEVQLYERDWPFATKEEADSDAEGAFTRIRAALLTGFVNKVTVV